MLLPLQNNLPHFLNIIQSAKLLESDAQWTKFLTDSRQGGGTQRERNWVKKSGIIERRKRHRREREKGKKPALLRNVRKKKKDCRLAPFGQRFTPYPPFRFPSALQQPLRSFFLCFFFFESVPAVGFVRSSLFSLFATNKPHRNISPSSRLWNLAIIRNDLRIWLKKKKRITTALW